MIKQDISNRLILDEEQYKCEEPKSVDDIFADADMKMEEQAQASTVRFKEKKKKHPVRNAILVSAVLLIVIIVAFVSTAVKYIINIYPQMKIQALEQYSSLRQELSAINDDELTVDQYYQKQFLLLFTDEDLEKMIVDIDGIGSLLKAISSNGVANVDLMPQNKVEQYKKLYEEYQNAKNAEKAESSADIIDETTHSAVEHGVLD